MTRASDRVEALCRRCRAGAVLVMTQTAEGARWHLEPSGEAVDEAIARAATAHLRPAGGGFPFGPPQQWGGVAS
ncbi:hypothetical protein [Segnochrobactrum spirostomi]|uniref:Uncharacterized protein n=1 Tax=Segnochrobactrum spirostomi TaxID=2608987 RepID=A0A6A7Y3J8_9HYPH|nr:hypothetical protein [Segnochrobactrum spirostomi]MQT13663.1 hypothetical protein [Segnochrobactrum spirostomi]